MFTPTFRIHNGRPADGALERTLYNIHAIPGIRQLADVIFPYRTRRRLIGCVRRSNNDRSVAITDPRDDALHERCKPDVEQLAKLIDCDLSHWL